MDLGKWLRETTKAVAAQVNPFDNGATYHTVKNKVPIAPIINNQPAPQQWRPPMAAPQNYQPPTVMPMTTRQQADATYGGGLSGIFNRARDIVDANTAADNIKRTAEFGLRETYDEQQRRENVAKVQDWQRYQQLVEEAKNQSNIDKIKGLFDGNSSQDRLNRVRQGQEEVSNARSSAEQLQRVPGAFAQTISRAPQGIFSAAETLGNKGFRPLWNQLLPGDPFNEKSTQSYTDELATASDQKADALDQAISESRFGAKEGDSIVGDVASAGGSLGAYSLLYALGGPTLANATTLSNTMGSYVNEAENAGMNRQDAVIAGAPSAIAQTGLESFGYGKLLKPFGSTMPTRALSRYVSEGSQEGLQQLTENIFARKYDPNRSYTEGVKEAFNIGGITGGLASGPVELGAKVTQPTGIPAQPGSIRERIQVAKEAVSQIPKLNQVGGINNPVNISEDPIADVESKIKQLNPNLDTAKLSDQQKRIALANIEQQIGRTNVDTGVKMFGSKKDMAKLRKITVENIQEIENEGERTAAKLVTKQRVLGEETKYEVNRSGDPVVEKYKTLALGGIPSKPAQNAEARAWYVENIPKYNQAIRNAQSIEEIRKAQDDLYSSANTPKTFTTWQGEVKTITQNEMKKHLGSRAYNLARGFGKGYSEIRYRPPTDFSFADKKTSTTKGTTTAGKPSLHGGEQVSYERKGAPNLKNKDPKSMVKDFGFKGLEYGNYVKNNESAEHMAKFGDSMLDLETVLGVDMTELNKKANLGVGFGSRGSGRALAHYEPSNKVVNITKKNTVDGSLAHEYMHAIDDFLGESERGGVYASNGRAVKPNTKQAMDALMSAIKKGDGTATIYQEYKGSKFQNSYRLDKMLEEVNGDPQVALNNYLAGAPGLDIRSRKRVADYLMFKSGVKDIKVPTGKSEFYTLAQEQGTYWERPTEMLARAFDGYIGNKLDQAGIKNNYVAKGQRSPGLMHPTEAHAKQLEPLFDNLFNAIKQDYDIPAPKTRQTKESAPITTPEVTTPAVAKQATKLPAELQEKIDKFNQKQTEGEFVDATPEGYGPETAKVDLVQEAKKFEDGAEFYNKMSEEARDELRNQGIRGQEQVDRFWNENVTPPPKVLNDLNPTKGIYVKYEPEVRAKLPLGENMTTLDKTLGGSPDDMVTIYRGTDKQYNQREIVPGDFVSTLPNLGEGYAGDKNVLSKLVRKGDILDDKSGNNYTYGEETIYRPNADKELNPVKSSEPKAPQVGKTATELEMQTKELSKYKKQLEKLYKANPGALDAKATRQAGVIRSNISETELYIENLKKKSTPVAQVGKTDPLANLKQEASKYGSAEDFADDAQDRLFFHGSSKENIAKIKKGGFANDLEKIYVSDNPYVSGDVLYTGGDSKGGANLNNVIPVLAKKGAKPIYDDTYPVYKPQDLIVLPDNITSQADLEDYLLGEFPFPTAPQVGKTPDNLNVERQILQERIDKYDGNKAPTAVQLVESAKKRIAEIDSSTPVAQVGKTATVESKTDDNQTIPTLEQLNTKIAKEGKADIKTKGKVVGVKDNGKNGLDVTFANGETLKNVSIPTEFTPGRKIAGTETTIKQYRDAQKRLSDAMFRVLDSKDGSRKYDNNTGSSLMWSTGFTSSLVAPDAIAYSQKNNVPLEVGILEAIKEAGHLKKDGYGTDPYTDLKNEISKKPFTPLSQPVDTTPPLAKQVTKKSDAKQFAETFGTTEQKAKKLLNKKPKDNSLTKEEIKNLDVTKEQKKAQKDYGVRELQEEPLNDINALDKKYLGLEDVDTTVSNRGTLGQTRDKAKALNPLRYAEKGVGYAINKASESDSRAMNRLARTTQYLFSKQAGQNKDIINATHKLMGEKAFTDMNRQRVADIIYKELLPTQESRAKVHAMIDPESLLETPVENKDGTYKMVKPKIPKIKDLTPNEKRGMEMLREYGDAINDTSYRNGEISEAKWKSNRGGKYMARLYSDLQKTEDVGELLDVDFGVFTGLYKSRKQMNTEMKTKLLKDPVKLMTIRARQVQYNDAMKSYMLTSQLKGYVSDTKKPGYVKVDQGKSWHNWAGKWVKQDVYENAQGFKATGQAMAIANSALDLWDGLPPRRWRKKMLTIYNPVVRAGNVTSNYFFAYLNGVNPITFQKNKSWAHKNFNSNDSIVQQAIKAGFIQNDAIVGDKNLFNKEKEFQNELDRKTQSKLDKARGLPKNADSVAVKRYRNADDIAKLAALKTKVDRGYSIDEAIEMTRRGFQDYARVGHAYDMYAKSPVFGNAFARFQGDLWMNIVKNDAIDHPVRLASLPAGAMVIGSVLSALSGEAPEDKEERESRAGAATIPLTQPFNKFVYDKTGGKVGGKGNISLDFQIPDLQGGSKGTLDVARFTPLYMRQGIEGTRLVDDLSRILPVNIPADFTKEEWISKAASDPVIGPLISLVGDTDWRRKSVSDPQGKVNGKELYPDEPLSDKEKWRNRLQYATRSYAPYPANEMGDILASLSGDQKNEQIGRENKYAYIDNTGKSLLGREGFNTSGSRKTTGQSLARLFGVRAEQFGPTEAEAQRETKAYFAKKDKKDKIISSLDSNTKKEYDALHTYDKKRSGAIEFDDDLRYSMKRAQAWLSNPELVSAERQLAILENTEADKPLHPKWNLNDEQFKAVVTGQSFYPGEGTDTKVAQLYESSWYDDYKIKENKYYDELGRWNKKQGYEDYKPKYKYPEGTTDLNKLASQYYDLESGTGEKTAMLRAYPQLTKLLADRKAYTNNKRVDLGLAPQENYYQDLLDGKESSGYGYSGSSKRSAGSGRSGGRKTAKDTSLQDSYKLQLENYKKLQTLLEQASRSSAPKKVATKKAKLKQIRVKA